MTNLPDAALPDQVTVQAGEDIAIVLTSADILHDFTIDQIDAHVAADAGETEEGGLRAEEPGRYTFYCSVPGHRDAWHGRHFGRGVAAMPTPLASLASIPSPRGNAIHIGPLQRRAYGSRSVQDGARS